MAGSNKVLKDGQVLFRAGDQSDGMYLIRRGELRVYLEQNNKEVALATIGEGGMIGEMALFDGAPRSASVKAVKEVEVTHISKDDFGKLMKQIPKWFVGLMSALSTRLRQTNERLQKLENGGAPIRTTPFMNAIRQLNILVLLWHRDGEKDGKDFILQKAPAEKALIDVFTEDKDKVKMLIEVLVNQKMLSTKQDSYKNVALVAPNRAALSQLALFIQAWVKANPKTPCLTEDVLNLCRTLEKTALASPYDTLTVSLSDLIKEGKKGGMNTASWEKALDLLANAGEEVRVVKTSGGQGLRTTKKDVSAFVRSHEALAAMYKANLA